jgi:hypothetical protein
MAVEKRSFRMAMGTGADFNMTQLGDSKFIAHQLRSGYQVEKRATDYAILPTNGI